MDWAKQKGIYSIALLGAKRGLLAEKADLPVIINSFHYGRVEDVHMHICHIICYAFMENEELQK